jgi:Predicted metal-dependent hydrolase of the TIM-barrel fold
MRYWILALSLFFADSLSAQVKKHLPIIDMHLHAESVNAQGPAPVNVGAPFKNFGFHDAQKEWGEEFMKVLKSSEWFTHTVTSPQTDDALMNESILILKQNNIYAVCSGEVNIVRKWKKAAPDRIINAVSWDFNDTAKNQLTVDSLTHLFKSGEFKVFGEVGIQYEGYSPSNPAFEPYLQMAESIDVPLAIHIGTGPPGSPYLGYNNYRAQLHSAFVLEEALVKHPKLRVYAMHAGWPMLDDMMAVLYTHPQLYVDLGVISYILPRKEFHRYLQTLVEAGFGKRIMFGSDQMVWPKAIQGAIEGIETANFLSAEQKRDIFFNNAARFLRLTDKQIKRMYAGLAID